MLNLRLASIRSSILVSKMASSTAAAQNRLGLEKSPYLLQHASNPVNWFPWGPEAFKVAKETNKPIFLSVGYSTCHWCHVMERESFKNQEIASFMNDHFVNIKMDREERPDVDKLYMSVITAMTGSGGWPLSVFLTPEGHPLTGATYLPPDDAFGQMGFRNILMLVSDAWKERREVITAQGRTMSEALKKAIQLPPTTVPPADVILKSTEQSVMQQYDKENAGFGIGPKFPKPVELDFLLYAYSIHRNKDTLEALEKTLHAIVLGGIHDHLDGGFHRYTVDKKWKVPHFEKMLYDQAQLLHIFATYYKVSHKYAEVIHGIVGYLKSNLAHPLGGFYSAEDAESIASNGTKSEGAYYTWSSKELKSILTDDEWKVARRYFNIEISGNIPAEADIRGELRDLNVLYVPDIPVAEIADSLDLSIEEFHTLLSSAKAKILEQRSKRQRPSTDTKIIASHNGLLISGLTAAYEAFPEKKEYLELAQKALGFVKKYLICPDTGKLLRTVYGDGEGVVNGPSKIPAFADDYASIIQACLDLYEADADDSHLRLAARLQQDMIEGYLSPQHGELPGGGFFYSRSGDPTLFARIQIDQDTSEPGFASVTTSNLLRLREYLGREDYDDMAHKVFASAGQMLEKASYAVPRMVRSIYAGEMGPTQILVKSNAKDCPKTTELLRTIRSFYLPDRSIIVIDKEGAGNAILEANPVVHTIVDSIKDDGPAVFLGRDGTYDTSSPLLTPQEVGEKLRSLSLKL